jgi:hypothetical protein
MAEGGNWGWMWWFGNAGADSEYTLEPANWEDCAEAVVCERFTARSLRGWRSDG